MRMRLAFGLMCFVAGCSGAAEQTGPTTPVVAFRSGFLATFEGAAGGPIDAASLSPGCKGWVSIQPNVEIPLRADFSLLRVLADETSQGAQAAGDLTLVVQRSDGTYLCNDNADGSNPIVEGSFPTGTLRVWVGALANGTTPPFALGFTEQREPMTADLTGSVGNPVVATPTDGGTPDSGTPTTPVGTTVSLTPGFTPDPIVMSGSAGGPVQASTLGPNCVGWVAAQPSIEATITTQFPLLRMIVDGQSADLTVMVQLPDGTYLCNDDSEGLNPMVEGAVAPGLMRVWVGTYQQGAAAPFRIGFSEILGAGVAQLGGTPMPTPQPVVPLDTSQTTSTSGTLTIAPRFQPDPTMVQGTAGGPLEASTIDPSCLGWISSTPNHILVTSSNFNFLRVASVAGEDTTMVMYGSDGTYRCIDDVDGLNPVIEGPFPAGTYSIWIGTYGQTTGAQYTLTLTSRRPRPPRP